MHSFSSELFGDKKRFVPLREIGLAILQCSIDKFCNPRFKPALLIRPCTVQSPKKTQEILAKDTQDKAPQQKKAGERKSIMPSYEDEDDITDAPTESFITFRDQTTTPGSNPRAKKRAGGNLEEAGTSKAARIDSLPYSNNTNFDLPGSSQRTQNMQLDEDDDDDPFRFDSSNALGKKPMEPNRAVEEREPVAERATTQKRARIESSSEEEADPFGKEPRRPQQGGDDDDAFGFEETSFTSTVAKRPKVSSKSPIKFFPSSAGPSRIEENPYESEDDDFNLEDNWLDITHIKVSYFKILLLNIKITSLFSL